MSEFKSPLKKEEIEANFAEIDPKMTIAEAAFEANRCLYCYDAPCTVACPTSIDVPSFIKKIASGNLRGSARVIFDSNPIGASCARVCPVEDLCEGACVEKTLVEKPIQIARLQRYATDHVVENDLDLFEIPASNGKSVAIIGSGPAGLSCAAYLARNGFAVTVYDSNSKAGGLNTYGMAEYKMTQQDSIEEVKLIERMGVKFVLETFVTSDEPNSSDRNEVGFEELRESHDAVFLAAGLGETNDLGIPGEEKTGVAEALEFIEKIKTREWSKVPLGKVIAVIGAGNTAVDVVTQAKRLGAEKVMMVYRRKRENISAYDYEYELAKSDAVEFVWQASPLEILGNGAVTGLKCKKNDGSDKNFEIPCDMVIKAIGQKKRVGFYDALGVETDEKGRVVVDKSMQTSMERVFAGGDCVSGGAEAVDAAEAGKLAAKGIRDSVA